ncbi:MAG: xanthine dehydrogenase family protein subunit M [Thermaerobacter sp.]|nr:molybdopterin dehydrogenase [Bacillota bacterium]
MKPPRFRYFAPTSVDEAVELLSTHADAAKVLAGGQSLVPMLNLRLARPEVLVDINRIESLSYLRVEDGHLAVGALARHRMVEKAPEVAARVPVLQEAVRHVGHVQIRNRGTVTGSIVHADPSAEMPAVLALLDGSVRVVGPSGTRDIPWQELFLTYFTTTLGPDELAVETRFPLPPAGAGWSFMEVARRHGDFALVAVAALVTADETGRVKEARLSLAGVGGTPVRPERAEALLAGQALEDDVLAAVADAVREAIEPESDIHASAEYRRHVAGVLAGRALRAAMERARRGGEG